MARNMNYTKLEKSDKARTVSDGYHKSRNGGATTWDIVARQFISEYGICEETKNAIANYIKNHFYAIKYA
ncbi:MAG TPA: hypothetical protein PLC53_02700, partial [Bacilli bacterium]|nr:hypothetical protein [Bacilli bacterium]